jgi:hypothetical protein
MALDLAHKTRLRTFTDRRVPDAEVVVGAAREK